MNLLTEPFIGSYYWHMHKTELYAIAAMGFHVAHNLGSTREFMLYDPESNSVELLPLPPEVTGVLIPDFLVKRRVSKVFTGELDAMVLAECQRLGLEVARGFDGEVQSLIEQFSWRGLEEDDHTHAASPLTSQVKPHSHDHAHSGSGPGTHSGSGHAHGSGHGSHPGSGGCGCGGSCGGTNIDSILEAMKDSIK
jgi:predicted Fe-Mo cluster-binding NifX family protein